MPLSLTVHPKKVGEPRDALRHPANRARPPEVCAILFAELENIGIVSCAFDRKRRNRPACFPKKRVSRNGLSCCRRQVGYREESETRIPDRGSVLICLNTFRRTLHINGVDKMCVRSWLGFLRPETRDFQRTRRVLSSTPATQMAAADALTLLALAHYENGDKLFV
jgi:hypothetical protein